jgi:ligand-binding sensor domain-containing protein
MRRRLLFFTIAILIYVIDASLWAQDLSEGSISGKLLMLDNKAPHVAVPVQAIHNGKVITGTLSDENGRYQLANLKPGQYQVRYYAPGGYVYYGVPDGEDRKNPEKGKMLQVRSDTTLSDIDFRFAPIKRGVWTTFDSLNGLPNGVVNALHADKDGYLWIGTGSGIFRFDGKQFINYNHKYGLGDIHIEVIYEDNQGNLWFGTGWFFGKGNGVYRFDGDSFIRYTVEDGLINNKIYAIQEDNSGRMWFGTPSGLSCLDGGKFISYTVEDGLLSNSIYSFHMDQKGNVWCATMPIGVSCYDGERFINYTDDDGLPSRLVESLGGDTQGNIWLGFGEDVGVVRFDGEEFRNYTKRDGFIGGDDMVSIYSDSRGNVWIGTGWESAGFGKGASRFDGVGFVNFTEQDGLVSREVSAFAEDQYGRIWFGTFGSGICCYDEGGFINYADRDGIPYLDRMSIPIHIDKQEKLWLGTSGSGVFRFDDEKITNYTTRDGLVHDDVWSIAEDMHGNLWFGTADGASLFNGERFANYTSQDGLMNVYIAGICPDRQGNVWFGGWTWGQSGVSRYDGEKFTFYSAQDVLVDGTIQQILEDRRGDLWFGSTSGGLSRYDGKEFVNYTTQDGLGDNSVMTIYEDSQGYLWFGTRIGGVSRYDGKQFVTYTISDGLPHNSIGPVHEDTRGHLWFGTGGSGVVQYDGTAFQSLDTRDGMSGDHVYDIEEDRDGYLWFSTIKGVTRYHRDDVPPRARMLSVTTDQRYDNLDEIPPFSVGKRITLEYGSVDLKTHPNKRLYRYRMQGHDADWCKPTRVTQVDYSELESGQYVFQVQAIDRDLNYSESASLPIVISPLHFYQTGVFILVLSVIGGMLLCATIILAIYRWRSSQAEKLRLYQELQDAREMQMSLLPGAAPIVEGMEIAGKSITANTVGGDFFDYLELPDGKVGIAMADVSGKGLRAAMNATLASGMLDEITKMEVSCGKILSELNAGLYPRMDRQMFTAFSFAVLNPGAGVIQWSNAGQPLPLIKRSDGVSEADGDGELPLGMLPDVKYPDYELKLQLGDMAIFYTDGIIEAENESAEIYGTDRLMDLVTDIGLTVSVEVIIEAILQDVAGFVGNAEQYDDMTIVAIKRTENSDVA